MPIVCPDLPLLLTSDSQYLQIEVPLIVFVIKENSKPAFRQNGVTEAK